MSKLFLITLPASMIFCGQPPVLRPILQVSAFRVRRISARSDLRKIPWTTDLYDRSNICCIEYALQTVGSIGLQSSDTHWLPLLPSLGVTWRF